MSAEQPNPRCILTVYAHPDDESFGPAAALARYARAGSMLYGLFGTRGEHGQTTMDPAPAPAELARLREADLREACRAIGYAAIDFWPFEDGTLDRVPGAELAARVLTAIRRYRPDVVITFGPAGITRHADHLTVHAATCAAFHAARAEGLDVRSLFYDAMPRELAAEMDLQDEPDGQPNTWIEVAATQPVKLEALRLHARHIKDAGEMLARLEREPQTTQTFYRAWPAVPEGVTLDAFVDA